MKINMKSPIIIRYGKTSYYDDVVKIKKLIRYLLDIYLI